MYGEVRVEERGNAVAGKLITVATFDTVGEAQLAKNVLATAGIPAALADEQTVGMLWHLSNAIGGVKVQVLEERAEEAVKVLDQEFGPEDEANASSEAETEPDDTSDDEGEPAESLGEFEATAEREAQANRVFFVAWLSLAIWPLSFYAFYLFVNAAFDPRPSSPQAKYHLFVGGLILAVPLLLCGVLFQRLITG